MSSVKTVLQNFFERNLFERIIVYIVLSELLVKIIFELILGQWDFIQGQNKQWFFYSFLALDYLISVKKVIKIRVTVNPMSLLAFVFLIMVAHGLFMGIMLGNSISIVANDTIPILMIALNILRMQSLTECKPFDLKFLLYFCAFVTIGTGAVGFMADILRRPSGPAIPEEAIFFPLFLAALYTIKPFPKWIVVLVLGMIVATVGDLNRTIMAFFVIVISGYTLFNVIRYPAKGLVVITVVLIVVSVASQIVPEDSKTYRRITGLAEVDLSQSEGSIGERQEEWRAINRKYEKKGKTIELFGLGFGGVYDVARTWTYLKNYGHAHYSWAWFKLRFGQIGYIYLFIFASALLYNGFIWSTHALRGVDGAWFIVFLCLISLLYCLTYVNAGLLMMGIQFIHYKSNQPKKSEEDASSESVQEKQKL